MEEAERVSLTVFLTCVGVSIGMAIMLLFGVEYDFLTPMLIFVFAFIGVTAVLLIGVCIFGVVQLWYKLRQQWRNIKSLSVGCDVARTGGDECVIVRNWEKEDN